MNHTLTGPEERWQREIDQRVAERLQRARQQRETDQARVEERRRVAAIADTNEAIASRRIVLWITASGIIALAAAIELLKRIHF